jgi:hypothetical protein
MTVPVRFFICGTLSIRPPLHLLDLDELQVGFVDKGSGLKDVTRAFTPHVTVGQTVQLLVDRGHESVERSAVSAAPRLKQQGEIVWFGWFSHTPPPVDNARSGNCTDGLNYTLLATT